MSRRYWPGVPDVVFGLVLASVLVGGRYRLLNDPGTLWHLRLGREILRTGGVPRADGLTFTRAGVAWVDQSWLFDAGLAALVDRGGWSAAALASAVLIAGVFAALARWLGVEGRSPLVVLVVALLAAGVGSIHFLVRPHLFTLAFVLAALWACRRQHDRGGLAVFLVPALTVPWANLHGGFLAAPVVAFTAAVGHAVSGPWTPARRRGVALFVAAGLLCLPAALVNPYGLGLYRHVGRLLVTSGVTELIEEYQPVPFGRPEARAVEWLILAMVALPAVSAGRPTRYDLAHALAWLHLSLASVRHAPLFALAAAPVLAALLDGLPLVRRGSGPDGVGAGGARLPVWPALAALGLGLAVASGVRLGGFDPGHWPLSALPAVNAAPRGPRLFHEQDWGGLIAAECRPPRPSFIDDRFELHGREAILRYVNALGGGPDWDELRDREPIGLVWVRPERGLARRLAADPAWRVRFRDAVSVLFERTPPVASRSQPEPPCR